MLPKRVQNIRSNIPRMCDTPPKNTRRRGLWKSRKMKSVVVTVETKFEYFEININQ